MIEVKEVVENPDGSADLLIDVSADGVKLLFQYGFEAVIKEAIELAKNEKCPPQV